MRKKREYTYIGDDVSKINQEQHFAFIENYQKSIFLSLLERNLITRMQYEQCIEELEHQRTELSNE